MRKKSNRFFAVVMSFIITASITVSAIILALSAKVQSVNSPLSVTYHANNVSATITASYQVEGSSSAVALLNSSNNTDYVKFSPTDLSGVGVLDCGDLQLSPTSSFAIFTFSFTNDSSPGAYDIKVSLKDNSFKKNITVFYVATGSALTGSLESKYQTLTSDPASSSSPTSIYVSAQSTGYFYLLLEISDIYFSAQYTSDDDAGLSWDLEHVDVINGIESGFGWTINNDNVVTSYTGGDNKVTIPSSATAINAGLFSENKMITSVTIPSSITRIGNRAFYNCSNITSMVIKCPATATVGSYALYGVDIDAITITNRDILKLTHLSIGHYPQTYVGNELNATLEGLYNDGNVQSGLTATGHSYTTQWGYGMNYTTLPEYIYNQNKYARLSRAIEYTSNNGFSDGTDIINDETYWFLVEPIPVKVLSTNSSTDDNLLTVMSDVVLGPHRYNYGSFVEWYNNPTIRTFLNGGSIYGNSVSFYLDALSDVSSVVQTTIKNQTIGDYEVETSGDEYNTTDYVWIPSCWEMTQSSNGFSGKKSYYDTSRYRKATDLAKAIYIHDNAEPYPNSYYWMRSIYSDGGCLVHYVGNIVGYPNSSTAFVGFAPCFAISI